MKTNANTVDYNNAYLADVLGANGDFYWCWINAETGAVLREFDETDLETPCEYVEYWDAGRETVVGDWVGENGQLLETLDETTIEAENELAFDDDFSFGF